MQEELIKGSKTWQRRNSKEMPWHVLTVDWGRRTRDEEKKETPSTIKRNYNLEINLNLLRKRMTNRRLCVAEEL